MAARPPNILFILADDMGYGDFSAFNGGLSATPTLDALMGEGVVFSQHYTASPVCNPSRACLLTGRYPHRTGSIDTLEWRGLERLALREKTLADMLRASGYAAGLVGKWHLGSFDRRYHPCNRGFDEAVCFRGGMHDYYQWRLEYGLDGVRRGDGTYLTDVWTEEACGFIERHAREPFLLHVTYNAPHSPLQVPVGEREPFMGREGVNWGVATVYGMIHRLDSGVARILETLDRLGLRDNTVVFFTSDNGPQFGGQGQMDTTRFNCHYRGAKGSVHEGGIRVPMVARWPDGLPAGTEVREMAHFADWLSTILAMTGTPVPQGTLPLDGVNILPVMRGERGETCTRRCWQWNRYTPVVECNAAIRDGDWKLVRPAIPEAMAVPDIGWLYECMYRHDGMIERGVLREPEPERTLPDPPAPQLFNVTEDPLEERDVAAVEPERATRLLRDLESWFEDVERDRRDIEDVW